MLTDQLEEIHLNYYNRMISQCESKLKEDWLQADTASFEDKLIEDRILYLKRWFGCHLCQLLTESCPVFQKTLNEGYSRK